MRPRLPGSAALRHSSSTALILVLALLLALTAAGPVAAADPTPDPSPTPTPSAEVPAEPSSPPEPSSSPEPTASPTPTPDPTPTPTPDPTASPTPSPTPSPTSSLRPYSLNLYNYRGYVRQYTSSWCVAAATQTMANFIRLRASSDSWLDKTYSRQRTIITYAKTRDSLTASAGSDPAGWAAALRKYGGGASYRWYAVSSYEDALRFAVKRLRATGRPVGILAWNGRHAWVLHGFTATADPASTDAFSVTSVRITGPLAGADPRNGTFSPATLKYRWGRYYERDGYMGWYGKFVLVAP